MRKIIQMLPASEYRSLTVLCNDGSMWYLELGEWKDIPAIPQDAEDDKMLDLVVAMGEAKIKDYSKQVGSVVMDPDQAFKKCVTCGAALKYPNFRKGKDQCVGCLCE